MYLPFVNNLKSKGMNLKEIAIFKHFIADNDLRVQFIKGYNRSKQFAKNPTNVEDFFSNADAMAIIPKAIRVFQPNSVYGYDFWQTIQEDWKHYYAKIMATDFIGNNDGKLERLECYYMILRENWNDTKKPWRYEQLEDAQCRLGLPITEKEDKDETVVSIDKTITILDYGSKFPSENEDEEDDELEFIEIATKKTGCGNYRLMQNEVSISVRKQNYRITLNQLITNEIRVFEKCYACLAKNKAGDIILQFNHEAGVNVTHGRIEGNHHRNACVCSKDLCQRLKVLLNFSEEYRILKIEKIKQTDTVINYIISK